MSKPIQNQSFLRLISVAIDPDLKRPELFYLLFEGEKDYPILDSGRIVFFGTIQEASANAVRYIESLHVDIIDIDTPFMCLDIPNTLYFLTEGNIDNGCVVLNSINLLIDLVKATSICSALSLLPTLKHIADYAMFSTDMRAFRDNQEPSVIDNRVNAVLLSIGAVCVSSRVIKGRKGRETKEKMT